MLSRAGAAILALTAVFLLAFSTVVLAWWDGHPSFGGNEQNRLTVHIGLLGAEGCKLDSEAGADVCEPLELGVGFTATGYIELAAAGMLMIAALVLAVLCLRGKSLRRTFAKIVMSAAGAVAIVAVALLVQGPDVKTKANFEIELPLNWGALVLLLLGLMFSLASGVLALQRAGALRPRSARPVWATNAAAPPPASDKGAPPAVDVLALLQEDQLRPRASAPAQPQSNPASAPEGPVARPSPPLFQGAPQLKPLYEVPGAAFVPPAPPPLPSRGPTPMPRAAVSAAAGIPTPPVSFDAARPKTLPPPLRGRPGTTAPPPPIVRPNPLALARTEPQIEAMRDSRPAIAEGKTIGPVVVPPPPPPPAPPSSAPQIPRPPIVASPKPPVRLDSEAFQIEKTVERPKQPAAHVPFSDKPTVQRPKPFEVNAHATVLGKRAAANAFEEKPTNALATGFNVATPSETGEDTDVAVTPAPGGGESFSTEFPTSLDPHAIAEVEARNRDKLAVSTDRDLPLVNDTEPVDPHAQTLGPMPTVQAALLAGKPRPSQPSVKVPISTAPDSLPPPTAKQTATVGPSPACPQCESPMAWVEEHLRFYCKMCKMYF